VTLLDKASLAGATPAEVRAAYEADKYQENSWTLATGYAQMALAAVPEEYALDFFTFCQRNSASCPVLEVLDPGDRRIRRLATADAARALGKYRVFRDGECVDEPHNIDEYWRDDLVTFMIGCTGSFESHMVANGIELRYLAHGLAPRAYVTNRDAVPSRRFKSRLVVSMRPIKNEFIARAVQLTSRFPAFHGAPVQIGNPEYLGVDIAHTYTGSEPMDIAPDETPVFWACSVTPQVAAVESKVPFMMTNAPGFMFVSDLRTEALATFA
jgi:uncharacterized protein YcsI (UPF0317 family)